MDSPTLKILQRDFGLVVPTGQLIGYYSFKTEEGIELTFEPQTFGVSSLDYMVIGLYDKDQNLLLKTKVPVNLFENL